MFYDDDYPLVTFVIKDNQYAITSKYVSNMVPVPSVRPVPQAPEYVRGIINLRGKVLPLIDLRVRLGYTSTTVELVNFLKMLEQHEQDHRNWLDELDASITENRPFKLTSDPHKCDFGKWYDNYETDDSSARAILRKFDRPHRKIHAIAQEVEKHQAQDNHPKAKKMVDDAKENELNVMVNLFANMRKHMTESAREIAMIVETPNFDYAVVLDMVKAVEFLAPGTTEKLPHGLDNGVANNLVGYIGRRTTDNSSVQVLDSGRICDPEDVKGLIQEVQTTKEKELVPA